MSAEDRFVIDTMLWSFSRLNSFYNCPYEWYLKFIECKQGRKNYFGQYGSF